MQSTTGIAGGGTVRPGMRDSGRPLPAPLRSATGQRAVERRIAGGSKRLNAVDLLVLKEQR